MASLHGRGLKPRITPAPQRAGVQPPQGDRMHDRKRDASEPWRPLQKTARWQRLVARIRARDGLVCQQTGELLLGRHPQPDSPVIDHIVPAREFWWDGRRHLFWDERNLQTVSKAYHDRVKQAEEAAARRRG